ncbi:MAG: hypothetical protein P1T08_04980 [Acidimicrobiia bacterium]|nr:hypothetical protein [Acidimicrobiia bacterium]
MTGMRTSAGRAGRAVGDAARQAIRAGGRGVDRWVSVHGPAFRRLAVTQAAAYAGDTLVAIGLAGTIFFDIPSAEARGKVALYLLLTLAPFVVLSPFLPRIFARLPNPYRVGLVGSGGLRAVLTVILVLVGLDGIWLFPIAFGLLVLSRLHGIARSSLLPITLPEAVALVAANSRLAQVGLAAGTVAALVGALVMEVFGPEASLLLAAVAFAVMAFLAGAIDAPRAAQGFAREWNHVWSPPRVVRLSMTATAMVRLLHGFLVLLLAFAFKEADAGLLDFGALLAAAGGGFGLSSLLAPWLERRLREEPMVVAALAVEAAAAFIAAQVFGLAAGAAVAAAAGLAWGTAKFAFDGMLQNHTPAHRRGLAFTRSETFFQIAWVLGAIVPVAIPIGVPLGLALAGTSALAVQAVIVSGLLVSVRESN